ncbi:putative membrane protein [Propionispora sp. 2/2-37]|uniref:hypothetical protein n=1 Tax=Propionispora sp. 2/2-37 TaxID=1677858 RepID=UPI0006BB88D2|nr:hypothetical protein [Propionispora sp. 2/2-37]CUH94196.1 putative membrane protein [Propionispora sp. 2/2-37]
MSDRIFELGSTFFAVICCAAAIKLADDYLDYELDYRGKRGNWAEKLGKSTMYYAMICMVVAAAIHTQISVSLFFSSYIVGMFNDMEKQFPSRLSGLQESLVLLLLGGLLLGWQVMFFSLPLVFSVQLIDDCIDLSSDMLAGFRNLAHRYGIFECLLLALLGLFIAWFVNDDMFFPVCLAIIVFYTVDYCCQGGRKHW